MGRFLFGLVLIAAMAIAVAAWLSADHNGGRSGLGDDLTDQTRPAVPAATAASCQDAITLSAFNRSEKDANPIPSASFRDKEICWQPVQGAASYDVTLTVRWYGNCEVWHSGATLANEDVQSKYSFPGDSTSMELLPPDPAYPRPKDLTFAIRAIDEAGERFLAGGFAYQREIDYPSECGPRETKR